jgi:hypothetical protein
MGIDEGTFRMMRIYGENIDDIIKKNEQWAIINKRDIENTRKYDLMVSTFKTSWLELSKTIMSELLPVIQEQLFPAIKNGIDYFRDNKEGIIGTIRTICELMLQTAGAAKSFAEFLGMSAGTVVGSIETTTNAQVTKAKSYMDKGLLPPLTTFAGGPLSALNQATKQANVFSIANMKVYANNPEEFSKALETLSVNKSGLQTQIGGQQEL